MNDLLSDLKVARTKLKDRLQPLVKDLIEILERCGSLTEYEEKQANELIDGIVSGRFVK